MSSSDSVHAENCCRLHGCRYGENGCPVVKGRQAQYDVCRECLQAGLSDLRVVLAKCDTSSSGRYLVKPRAVVRMTNSGHRRRGYDPTVDRDEDP